MLCLPLLPRSQYVKPIRSALYEEKVKRVPVSVTALDSISNQRNKVFRLKPYFRYYSQIKSLTAGKDSFLSINYASSPVLNFSGTYSAGVEWKLHNRIPELQSGYVQGRSLNGLPAWQGPETNEVFSYGPDIQTLEFDGSPYPYDNNGKLVAKGNGNGHPATAYNNALLRMASGFLQQLNIKGEIVNESKKWAFGLSLAQGSEQTLIKSNNASTSSAGISIQRYLGHFTLSGNYHYSKSHLTNSNWNGFLNQTYQQALLTPVSFSNAQGTRLGSGQRSYSNLANNPEYLLEGNDNGYNYQQQTAGFTARYFLNNWQVELAPSLLTTSQQDNATYKAGSVLWPDGMFTHRNKSTQNFTHQTLVQIPINYSSYKWRQQIQLKHLYTHERTSIQFMPNSLFYCNTRPANELMFHLTTEWNTYAVKMKLVAGNRAYTSGTVSKNAYWLPSLQYTLTLNASPVHASLNTSYVRFNSEVPLNQSIAGYNLLQYTTQQALAYRPVLEISSFNNVAAIENTEWNTGLTLSRKQLVFTAGYYIRYTRNDVYPVFSNGAFQLQNIADVRKHGFDLSLSYNPFTQKEVRFSGTVSFFSYRNIVTRVQAPYNLSPLGGFSNVHTALAEGQPFGVIVGNDYQRDAANRVVIGNDGFPVASPAMKILGNPNPDFVLKTSLLLTWKPLTLSTDVEWKKGGDIWNGTQAVLDYYGRSAATARLRNTTGYLFDGVLQNGTKNTTRVAFYNTAMPFANNRWVRYGHSGVTSDYIQLAGYLRINNIKLAFQPQLFKTGTRIRAPFILSVFVRNILLWSPYKTGDPSQTLFEQSNTTGLDFFNLPAYRTYGCNLTFQF